MQLRAKHNLARARRMCVGLVAFAGCCCFGLLHSGSVAGTRTLKLDANASAVVATTVLQAPKPVATTATTVAKTTTTTTTTTLPTSTTTVPPTSTTTVPAHHPASTTVPKTHPSTTTAPATTVPASTTSTT